MGQWNSLVVSMFFDKKIANDICKIHVCKNGGDDQLIWAETSDGILNVKSTYYVVRRLLGKHMPDRESKGKVWRFL